jgi:hypothetical protein
MGIYEPESYDEALRLIKERADDFTELLVSSEPVDLKDGRNDYENVIAALFLSSEKRLLVGQPTLNRVFCDGILHRLKIPMTFLNRAEFLQRIGAD